MSYYNNIEAEYYKNLTEHYYNSVRDLNLPHSLWFGRNIIIYSIMYVGFK